MAQIHAVMGNKGGQGKTAELIGLAYALAKQGRRVVVADMDAQGNATRRLGVDKAALLADDRPGIADMLDPKSPAHVDDVAVACGWPDPAAAGIRVLPSLDRESLAERNEEAARPGAATRLARSLANDRWTDDVDDVLIDTGPAVDHLLHLAVNAADRALLVTDMTHDSIEGALYLASYLDGLRSIGAIDTAVAGVLVNAYDKDAARQVKYLAGLPAMFQPWGGAGVIWLPAVPYIVSLANSHDQALPVAAIRHVSVNQLGPVYDAHATRLISSQSEVPA